MYLTNANSLSNMYSDFFTRIMQCFLRLRFYAVTFEKMYLYFCWFLKKKGKKKRESKKPPKKTPSKPQNYRASFLNSCLYILEICVHS